MKILLMGANGQIGWELRRSLMPLGEVIASGREECDLSQPARLPGLILGIRPDVIVNAAAYTDVERAERDEALATVINGTSVGVLAEICRQIGALLVHYSTDYVFDGKKSVPYDELDPPRPLNAYGRSKLAGEAAIREAGGDHVILRTSWAYGIYGNNFIKKVLRLAREQDEIRIVTDQRGAPTSAELIADVTALMIYRLRALSETAPDRLGIFHLAAAGETTWYEFARTILQEVMNSAPNSVFRAKRVLGISSAEFPTQVERPTDSRFTTDKLRGTYRIDLPEWRTGVARIVRELIRRERNQ